MNYRHAFHAGNFADVFKHVLLTLAVESLKRKDKPFVVIDTHAGVGLYDLTGEQATRTGEWAKGIGRVMDDEDDLPAQLAPYLGAVKAENPDGGLRFYPGSPRLIQGLLRADDRLQLCELHPEDVRLLSGNMRRDLRVKVEHRDGYEALKAYLPPKERRGLVHIDPPFERGDEYVALLAALQDGVRRWASGTFCVWYPIKDPIEGGAFLSRLVDAGLPKLWTVEMFIRPPQGVPRLDGCGMVFVNPPYLVQTGVEAVMQSLTELLALEDGAFWTAEWLTPE